MKLTEIREEPPKGKTLWYSEHGRMRVDKLIHEHDQYYLVCNTECHYLVMKHKDKVLYDGFCNCK